MHAQRKGRNGDLKPVIVAAIVAVVGQAAILWNDFGASNDPQGSGKASMITTAVVYRAGAIEIPSKPAAPPVS
jgi:membrane protein involved in colicin uptake